MKLRPLNLFLFFLSALINLMIIFFHSCFISAGFHPPTGAEVGGSRCSVSVRKSLCVLQAYFDPWRSEPTSGQDPKRNGQPTQNFNKICPNGVEYILDANLVFVLLT